MHPPLVIRLLAVGSLCGLSLGLGCQRKPEATRVSVSVQQDKQRLNALTAAELSRDARIITVDDLMSRDVLVRRRAMQCLARIGDPSSRGALERGLADEDGDVVGWAAFGLGRVCDKDPDQAVAQLALRATSWVATDDHPQSVTGRFSIEPLASMATAIGRCGGAAAEATLASWVRLNLPLSEHAALALGSIAAKRRRLESSTYVALLDAADQKPAAPDSALFPFTRLSAVDNNVQKRLLSVAKKNLGSKGDAQYYAVRALPLAGDSAAGTLERIALARDEFPPELRTDAIRGLARLGEAGQQSLQHCVEQLVPKAADITDDWLLSAEFSPIAETLAQLTRAEAEVRSRLEALARLSLPSSEPPRRRARILRCSSAALLAHGHTAAPVLSACDPDKNGRDGALAQLRVLGQSPIRGRRAAVYAKLVDTSDPIIREAALKLLRSHPEIRQSAHYLANALASDSSGVVATAANILAENPERAQAADERTTELQPGSAAVAPNPTPEVLLALNRALLREWEPDAVDVRLQLIDAISVLGVLSAKNFLEEQCRSRLGVIRGRAEVALHRLGDRKKRCQAPTPVAATLPTLSEDQSIHLRILTDIGALDLWLEANFAPATAARLMELVKSGFYDQIPVHRVVPGFVAQLGDRDGDGYGGTGQEPLPDELAPFSFRSGDVGLALSGPDTGSSQLFVLLGPHPHLDGEYTRVGRAGAGWNRVVVGDVIKKIEIVSDNNGRSPSN